jgi:sugar lactone lactonase YvrE
MYVPELTVAQLMKQYTGQYDFYISPVYQGLPPEKFLAPEVPPAQNYPGEWAIPLDTPPGRNLAFIIDPPTAGDFARLVRLYPHAQFNILRAPSDSQPLQYTAFIAAADNEALHGVRVRFYAPDAPAGAAPLSERVEPAINHTWAANDPQPPFRVRYEATLRLPRSSTARLHLAGDPAGARVTVDGFAADPPRLLGAGLHTLLVETTVRSLGEQTRLLLSLDGDESEVAPTMLFKPQVVPHGLTGYYRRGADFSTPPSMVRIDPVISFYFHERPLERPYTVEWRGKLFIPSDGSYALGLEQISKSSLEIDGRLVIENASDNSYQESQLPLTRGFHDIRVLFQDLANYSHVYLWWAPPNRDRSILPSYFLWPEMAAYPDPAAGGSWPTLNDSDGREMPAEIVPVEPPVAPLTPGPAPTAPVVAAPTVAAGAPPPVSAAPTPLPLPPGQDVAPTVRIAFDKGEPRGLTADSAGNLYVVTGGESVVHKYGPAGQEITSWPVLGRNNAPAQEPFSIAVVGAQVVVLDAATADLLIYDLNGKPAPPVHLCECFFPRGMLAEADGTLWVADTGGARLVHATLDGKHLGTLGQRGSGPGQFVEPAALWRAADGTLFVVDIGNGRVQRLSAAGQFEAEWAIGPSIARDGARLTGDAAGHIYVTLPTSGQVAVYDRAGQALTTWQSAAERGAPSGIATVGALVAVAYPAEHRVWLFPILP